MSKHSQTPTHPETISLLLPNLAGGGAERVFVTLANEWASCGYKIELVLMRNEGQLFPIVSDDVDITILDTPRIRNVIRPLAKHLKKSRPDVVLSAMWPLTSASVIAWIISGAHGKLFLSDHNTLSQSVIRELGVSRLALMAILRSTYPFASGRIIVSEAARNDLCGLGGLTPSKVDVIYNPAATNTPKTQMPTAIREDLWGTGYDHHILSVGSLKPQKDHETLLRAVACLRPNLNLKVVILGEGLLQEKIESLVAELKLQSCVSLTGFVLDPTPWYRTADLFVLSSRWEGFGNVIVEALENHLPVVSTDCPSGPSEILEGGRYGKLVPVQDPEAMAAAIHSQLHENTNNDFLAARAQDFSVKTISKQYLNRFFPTD